MRKRGVWCSNLACRHVFYQKEHATNICPKCKCPGVAVPKLPDKASAPSAAPADGPTTTTTEANANVHAYLTTAEGMPLREQVASLDLPARPALLHAASPVKREPFLEPTAVPVMIQSAREKMQQRVLTFID